MISKRPDHLAQLPAEHCDALCPCSDDEDEAVVEVYQSYVSALLACPSLCFND
jgi:hypothetical protein